MEGDEGARRTIVKKKRKAPPSPIQTYRWEDLRRSKRRGAYPWTHLFKKSFEALTLEEIERIMEEARKKGKNIKRNKYLKKRKSDEASSGNSVDSQDKEEAMDVGNGAELCKSEEVDSRVAVELEIKPEKPSESLEAKGQEEEGRTDIVGTKKEEKLSQPVDDQNNQTLQIIELENNGSKTPSESGYIVDDSEVRIIPIQRENSLVIEELAPESPKAVTKPEAVANQDDESKEDSNEIDDVEQYLDKDPSESQIQISPNSDLTGDDVKGGVVESLEKKVEDEKQKLLQKIEQSNLQASDSFSKKGEKKRKAAEETSKQKKESFLRKLKDTKFKAPKLLRSKPISAKKEIIEEKEVVKIDTSSNKKQKSESPKYIYIPLSPPPEEEGMPQKEEVGEASTADSTGKGSPLKPSTPEVSPVLIKHTKFKAPKFLKKKPKIPKEATLKVHIEKQKSESPKYTHIPLHAPEGEAEGEAEEMDIQDDVEMLDLSLKTENDVNSEVLDASSMQVDVSEEKTGKQKKLRAPKFFKKKDKKDAKSKEDSPKYIHIPLHAPEDEVKDEKVGIEKQLSIEEIKEAKTKIESAIDGIISQAESIVNPRIETTIDPIYESYETAINGETVRTGTDSVKGSIETTFTGAEKITAVDDLEIDSGFEPTTDLTDAIKESAMETANSNIGEIPEDEVEAKAGTSKAAKTGFKLKPPKFFKKKPKEAKAKEKKLEKEKDKGEKQKSEERDANGQPKYIHIPLHGSHGEESEKDLTCDDFEFEIQHEETSDLIIIPVDTPTDLKPTNEISDELAEITQTSDVHIIPIKLPPSPKPRAKERVTIVTEKCPDYVILPMKAAERPIKESKKVQEKHKDYVIIPVKRQSSFKEKSDKEKLKEKYNIMPDISTLPCSPLPIGSQSRLDFTDFDVEGEDSNEKPESSDTIDAEELKSSLKVPGSPPMDKKVSFKDRSISRESDDTKVYETVEVSHARTEKDENVMMQPTSDQTVSQEENGAAPEETSRDDAAHKWSNMSDHEYEPINPPAESGPPTVHVTDTDLEDAKKGASKQETHRLHLPSTEEISAIGADSGKDTADTIDGISAEDLQSRIEDTFFSATPDRTTCEINTSQADDTSALEHLPLNKGSRKKAKAEKTGPTMQDKLRTHAGRLKTKITSIKKPTINLPKRPKFKRPEFKRPTFEKPSFTLPKLPDRPKISLPSLSLRKAKSKPPPADQVTETTTTERNEASTEPTEPEEGPKKRSVFDFSTYPRIFKRKPAPPEVVTSDRSVHSGTPVSEFCTGPRANGRRKKPTWAQRFREIRLADLNPIKSKPKEPTNFSARSRSTSMERRMLQNMRYNQELDDEDECFRKYQNEPSKSSYLSRWKHGSFKEGKSKADDDSKSLPADDGMRRESYQTNQETHSSGSSSERHRRGVLEEIDSDEFFLRQKGISQDNIEVGMYLSSEIRDAFRAPTNALAQKTKYDDYDLDLPAQKKPVKPKRTLKKSRRQKKTPHVSNENVSFDQDDDENIEPNEYPMAQQNGFHSLPPLKPSRSKKQPRRLAKEIESIDYADNDSVTTAKTDEASERRESVPNIIGALDRSEEHIKELYEKSIQDASEEQKRMTPGSTYTTFSPHDIDRYLEEIGMVDTPKPPTRKNKSLKSLNYSEHDSIIDEINFKESYFNEPLQQEVEIHRVDIEHDEAQTKPPEAPKRQRRSRSRTTSQMDEDALSQGGESFISDGGIPCEEPLCVLDRRDSSGYAVIDRTRGADKIATSTPTAPRRHRSRSSRSGRSRESSRSAETKFFTVPRDLNDSLPVRPVRNYSTLGPSRPPRRRSSPNLEEKENLVSIIQYMEVSDDDHGRDLGIMSKMKGRPLPAPPRPPRKQREDALRDITSEANNQKHLGPKSGYSIEQEDVEEIEVSTQTDPLPDDFVCEDFVEEPTDRIIIPRSRGESPKRRADTPMKRMRSPVERNVSPFGMVIEQRIETPTPFDDEPVTTRASIVVQPMAERPKSPELMLDPQISSHIELGPNEDIPISYINGFQPKEQPKLLEATTQVVIHEQVTAAPKPAATPEIPPMPAKDTSAEPPPPQQVIERIIERPMPYQVLPGPETEIEVLRAQRLQVSDLDVERLSVSSLQAGKIQVSEIDSYSLQISEINSKGGNIVVNNLEISPDVLHDILEKLSPPPAQPTSQMYTQTDDDLPPKTQDQSQQPGDETPQRPKTPLSEQIQAQILHGIPYPVTVIPPEYLQSLPPASFYTLRSPPAEGDIPVAPHRRHRHHARHEPSASSSEEEHRPATHKRRSEEPSIAKLSTELAKACSSSLNNAAKQAKDYVQNNVLSTPEGRQKLQVAMVLLLIIIAGLIFMGFGGSKTIHHHHWEYFNPPME